MQRVVIASLIAAVAVAAWDYTFWTSGIGRSVEMDAEASDEREIMKTLDDHLDRSGWYVVGETETGIGDGPDGHTHAQITFTKDGPSWYRADATNQVMLAALLVSFVVGMLLYALRASLTTFRERFLCVVGIGAASAIWTHLPGVLMKDYTLANAGVWFLYDTASWAILGVILAAIVKEVEEEEADAEPKAVV